MNPLVRLTLQREATKPTPVSPKRTSPEDDEVTLVQCPCCAGSTFVEIKPWCPAHRPKRKHSGTYHKVTQCGLCAGAGWVKPVDASRWRALRALAP